MLTDFSGSSATTYQLLTEKKSRSSLKTVHYDGRTLGTSRGARTTTQKDAVESSLSLIGDEEFDFDDIVINSTAYRRAFLAIQARQTHPESSTGAQTGGVAANAVVPSSQDLGEVSIQRQTLPLG